MANVRVYFITNRNLLEEGDAAVFGARFNPDGVAALRFGHASFTIGGDGPTLDDLHVYKDPKVLPGTPPPENAGSAAFLDDLRKEMLAERDTLIFIHGFNVTFMEALNAAARLAHSIPQDINVVVFSWPSDGKAVPFMSYYSDREDARASGPALARAYLKLFDFIQELREAEVRAQLAQGSTDLLETKLCQRCLHVLAHSMGNYVLRHGLQAIRAKDPRKMVRMFDQVILAAPDEDDDSFEDDDKLRLLPTLAQRITVYHNRRDRALVISDKTKANPDRLGSEGPRMLDMLPKKVIIVDCSRIAPIADPTIFHSYYINNLAVGIDLTETLNDSEVFTLREVVRPERAYRIRGEPPVA